MNTTTPLTKGGFVLLVHPRDAKVLLVTPSLYKRTIGNDPSFMDCRQWFHATRSLFPSGKLVLNQGQFKMGGRTRSPEYVKRLRKKVRTCLTVC